MLRLMWLLGASAFASNLNLIPAPESVVEVPGCTFELPRGLVFTDGFEQSAAVHFGESATDESYQLVVRADGVRIDAPGRLGALHAIATLKQLIGQGRQAPCVRISDQPRFPWRGLLLDVSRHFIPVPQLQHTLDRMAEVKLNVLHWHLSDDQAVRVESVRFPLLQQKASGGLYYTQDQIRTVIGYAGKRGIRIVPEFDFPGHATAWFAAYPEFASKAGPYSIERGIGIFDPAFDPSNPKTYEFLEGFLGEMAALFPDPYMHLGGDEVSGKHWMANPAIVAFQKAQGLQSTHELQIYFESRVERIMTKLGKKLVLWDEAIHPRAAPGITYQAWRGPNALLASAFLQHPTLVSYGFYLDWGLSAEQLYRNQLNGVLPDETDPILKRLNPLIPIPANRPAGQMTEAEAAERLGGEAALWSEFTTPDNLEIRLWPRAAAVAERLWSAAGRAVDLDDLYRRLAALPGQPRPGLLEEILEPGKYVYRHLSHKYTVDSPMDQLVDRLPPESMAAREFRRLVERREYGRVRESLTRWNRTNAPTLGAELSADVVNATRIGLETLDQIEKVTPLKPEWKAAQVKTLKALGDNHREIVIAIVPALLQLLNALPVISK